LRTVATAAAAAPGVELLLLLLDLFFPKKPIPTNLHYDLDYNFLLKKLPNDAAPAYDGLKIKL
tara:strand:- start:272 stop:460 length:189 start_codon:yes stop_codon:yes gene_type:complete